MKNEFYIGKKDEDALIIIESEHTPNIGDTIHYLCDGSESNYDYLKETGNTELEGIVVSKWASLSYKSIIWTVECE